MGRGKEMREDKKNAMTSVGHQRPIFQAQVEQSLPFCGIERVML